MDDVLEVELSDDELKEKSLKLGFSIAKKERAESMASCYLAVVATDRNSGKATQILKEIVDKLRPFSKQIL